MTHLRIEQNNIQENVSSAVIKKLYELATSGDLDQDSNLAGNLHTTATYQEYIDVLHTAYPDLYISATTTYMMFEDPEVENKLKNYVGDGVGVSADRFLAMTQLPNGFMSGSDWINIFIRDTSLIKFNELALATNCTTLGDTAFETCSNLEQINISNITSVGNDCFQNCRKCVFNGTLSNLQSIGSQAFQFCYELTGNLVLPHVSSMGNNAFEACKISSVNLTGSTITTIPNSAFANISTLTTATVPTSVTEIVWRAFGDDSALTTVSGLSNVTTIGGHAFESCSNLTTIDIDWTKVTGLGEYAFLNCGITGALNLSSLAMDSNNGAPWEIFKNTNITSVTSLGSTISIPRGMFEKCSNLTSVTLPSTCHKIWQYAFCDCTNLSNINLDYVEELASWAFRGCSSLTGTLTLQSLRITDNGALDYTGASTIVLPAIETFNAQAFYDGNTPTTLDCGPNLTYIGAQAFWSGAIQNFIFRSTTVPTYADNGVRDFCYIMTGRKIYVPDAAVNDYKAAWTSMASYIYPLSDYTSS